MLQGKKILLGVCGSIAAYKAALLVRLLKKSGAEVQVLMTSAAHEFITPLTLSTLSNKPVYTHFSSSDEGEWTNHVELGLWADLMLIAPATANTMAKLANGICDSLLAATYLSARCPVVFAPAMDLDMYQHPATKNNMALLRSYGNEIIAAEHGELASGLVGTGRMAEPEHIIDYLEKSLGEKQSLLKKKVLITAGPTYEAIDPVRFIGNHSSGKMGIALARRAADMGATVNLILGPGPASPQQPGIEVQRVNSAQEMYEAANNHFEKSEIVILAAAVADYAPEEVAPQKIKKSTDEFSLKLKKTIDIAKTLGAKKSDQFIVGFALETENEVENASAKLRAKNFDLIVLNSLNDQGAGFKGDTNQVTIIDRENNKTKFELKSKAEVAKDILNEVNNKINKA